jgi:hypothetical protein
MTKIKPVKFRHELIDANPNGTHHDVCLIADINGDGLNDIIIGAFKGEDNLVWYEAPSWKRHVMSTAGSLLKLWFWQASRSTFTVIEQIRFSSLEYSSHKTLLRSSQVQLFQVFCRL